MSSLVTRRIAARALLASGLAVAALGRLAPVSAGEDPAAGMRLAMFETPGCEWCDLWDAEVGVVYARTPEGAAAPLVRLDKNDDLPAGVRVAADPVYTPTFVLLENGEEIGRIEGYPGEDFFWGLLQKMLRERGVPLDGGS